jgi:surface antigen
MDAGAQQRQAQALREAMRTQRPVHWQGAEAAGSVIPRQVVMREGQACRMTTITTIIDGRVHSTDVCVRQGPGVGEFTVVQ